VAYELMTSSGARDDVRDFQGRTALIRAAQGGREQTLKAILRDGRPDIDRRDNSRRTALDYARRGKHDGIVSALLSAGASE
jgi:ankyrin repeat protein